MNVEESRRTYGPRPGEHSWDSPVLDEANDPQPSVSIRTPSIAVADRPQGLLELILKGPEQLDRLIRNPDRQAELLPRFLAISLTGFTFFGIAMSLVLSTSSVWPQLSPMAAYITGNETAPLRFVQSGESTVLTPWVNGNAFRLIGAYAIGLVAATGICLPSLYFYSLLAGVRMTMMDVVLQTLKSKAVGAVTLVGILPIYATFGLAIAIFPMPEAGRNALLMLGLMLPFIAGAAGTYSLYHGLAGFADTMPAERREQRACFLRRLVLSWAACYSAISPVLIFTLWQRWQS